MYDIIYNIMYHIIYHVSYHIIYHITYYTKAELILKSQVNKLLSVFLNAAHCAKTFLSLLMEPFQSIGEL